MPKVARLHRLDEVPAECGVMLMENQRLVVARAAPRRERKDLPFGVWLALAKATPLAGLSDDDQGLLGCGVTDEWPGAELAQHQNT